MKKMRRSNTPDWVHTTLVPRQAGGKPIRYICINDLPTLIWCANLASLELHPFLHREGNLNCPTSVVFDLDPGDGADLATCAEVALLLRAHLATGGLACFPKVSGCGNPLDSGKVVVTFSTGYPALGLQSLRQGRWDGTWSTKGQQLSQITVTVTATSADGQLGATRILKGGLGAVRQRPSVADGGVVSEVSPVPQVPLAPGSRIAIQGQRLSNTDVGGGIPLPTELAGTIVTIAGRRLYLEKSGDGLVNAIVPFGLEINTIHQLLVQRDYTYSDPVYVNMAPAQPAILVNAAGQPVILDRAGVQVGPRNPVKAGDRITIQCTGLGAVDSDIDPSTPLPAGQTVLTELDPHSPGARGGDGWDV
jgi:uncharacterized protein (TIGR03437 family)